MKLVLKRRPPYKGATIGELFHDGHFLCYTCEDVVRDLSKEPKVPGETAIPEGTYKIIINMSARFKKYLPLLLNVPQFEGIRIHPGNTKKDTEGCILPGTHIGLDNQSVIHSRVAFVKLFSLITIALNKGEQVTIEIINHKE